MATDEGEIIGKLIAARSRVAGQKDAAPKESVSLDVQSWPAWIICIHVELVQVPLQSGFVERIRTELMEPRSLQRAVPVQNRGPP